MSWYNRLSRALFTSLVCAVALAASSPAVSSAPSVADAFSQPMWRRAVPIAALTVDDTAASPAQPIVVSPSDAAPTVAPVVARVAAVIPEDLAFQRERFERGRRLHIIGNVLIGAGLLAAPAGIVGLGLAPVGAVTSFVCGIVQYRVGRRLGQDAGFVVVGVVPTRSGLAVVG